VILSSVHFSSHLSPESVPVPSPRIISQAAVDPRWRGVITFVPLQAGGSSGKTGAFTVAERDRYGDPPPMRFPGSPHPNPDDGGERRFRQLKPG
jgi:hypothetical protein